MVTTVNVKVSQCEASDAPQTANVKLCLDSNPYHCRSMTGRSTLINVMWSSALWIKDERDQGIGRQVCRCVFVCAMVRMKIQGAITPAIWPEQYDEIQLQMTEILRY